jgi:hypothetical protein
MPSRTREERWDLARKQNQHDVFCHCDRCEGTYYLDTHIPSDCLFDDDVHTRPGSFGAKQNRYGLW